MQLMMIIQKLSLKVPDDLSLVFLSDTWGIPFANPTRVRLNRDLAGQVAVQRLVKRLEGTLSKFEQIRIPCEFIIGDTAAPR